VLSDSPAQTAIRGAGGLDRPIARYKMMHMA